MSSLKVQNAEGQKCHDCEKKVSLFPISEFEEYQCKGCQAPLK